MDNGKLYAFTEAYMSYVGKGQPSTGLLAFGEALLDYAEKKKKKKKKKKDTGKVGVIQRSDKKDKKFKVKNSDGSTTHFGAKGYSISPGTEKGRRYCSRSSGIQGKKKPGRRSANELSRRMWNCQGKNSVKGKTLKVGDKI